MKLKRLAALMLCILMAAACLPVSAAPLAPGEKADDPQTKVDVTNYIEDVTLGAAAASVGSVFYLEFESDDPDMPWEYWYDTNDSDDPRYIAHAYVPEGGSFVSSMSAQYLANAGTQAITFDYWLGIEEEACIEVKVTMNGSTQTVFRESGEGIGYSPEWKTGFADYTVASDNTAVTVTVSYVGNDVPYGKGAGAKGGDDSYGDHAKNLYIRNFYVQDGLEGALNAPDWAGLYTFSSAADFGVEIVPFWNRVALSIEPNTEGNGATVYSKIAVRAGDVLGFDVFTFRTGSVKSPLSFYVGSAPEVASATRVWTDNGNDVGQQQSFQHVSYTFPSKGEYYVIWNVPNNTSGNNIFIDNFTCTPRITLEEAAADGGFGEVDVNLELHPTQLKTTWRNGWVPAYNNNSLLLAKTNNSGVAGSTATMSAVNMQKAGDEIVFDYYVSSEKNYDIFTFKVNGEVVLEKSGETSYNQFTYTIPADGLYTYEWSYKKDSSVNSGADCAKILDLVIPQMTLSHAASIEDGDGLFLWKMQHGEWGIVEKDGEYVVASNNHAHSSQAVLYLNVDLIKGDVISFDYIKDAEANYDKFTFSPNIEGQEDIVITARSTDWQHFSYTMPETGAFMMFLIFEKDSSVSVGDDCTYIRNIKLNDELNRALNVEGGTLKFRNCGIGMFEPYTESSEHFCARYVCDGEEDAMVSFEVEELSIGDVVSFDYKVVGDGSLQLTTGGWGIQWTGGSTNGQWRHVIFSIEMINELPSVDWYAGGEAGSICCLDNVTFTHYEGIITEVYVDGFGWPVAGETAGSQLGVTIPEYEYYIITENYWYCDDYGAELNEGDVFEAGHMYSECACIEALDGFRFAEDCAIYLNGGTERIDIENSGVSYSNKARIVLWTIPVECEGAGLLGDADGSGTVNANDALMIMRYALGLIPTLPNYDMCDVNHDGVVNANDALMVMRYALGLISL